MFPKLLSNNVCMYENIIIFNYSIFFALKLDYLKNDNMFITQAITYL